jgi:sterol 24-C-methyltransferase
MQQRLGWPAQNYHATFGGDLAARKKEYQDMVNKYYDLATSFYEYGA